MDYRLLVIDCKFTNKYGTSKEKRENLYENLKENDNEECLKAGQRCIMYKKIS